MFTKREESKEANPRQTTRRRGKLLVALVVLVAAAVVAVVLARREGIDVRGAFHLARTASEEAATTARVKTALALSQKVSAFDIDVDTQGGVVRLTGEVPSQETRALAVAIARDTSGVAEVQDHLVVDPRARPSEELERLRNRVADLEIQAALESALRSHPELGPKLGGDEEVTILVENQRVELSGSMDTAAEKYGVERLARSIEGVESVVSSIEVERGTAAEGATGEDLAKRVEFELFAADAFDLERLDVRASGAGAVTLTGEVRSQAEKLLAARLASEVQGVDEVRNELEVAELPGRAGPTPESSEL